MFLLEEDKTIWNFLVSKYFEFETVFNVLFKILIVYTIIYTIVFFISMYKFAKKEHQPVYKYVIPFLNWWYYFKLCNIPRWIVLIPVLNIIAQLVSPAKLAYEYKYSMSFGVFGIFIPIYAIPVIAFSKNKSRRRLEKSKSLQTVKSIKLIEEKLENEKEEDYDNFNLRAFTKRKEKEDKNRIEEKIKKIEEDAIKDDYDDILYGDDLNEKSKAKMEVKEMIQEQDIEELEATEEKMEDEIVELDDKEEDLKVAIKKKEEDIENKSTLAIEDNANYQDYEFLRKDNTTIAFGGKNEVKKKARNVTEEKAGRNRCPRCNTPIDNTMDICPGCGMNLRKK